MVGRVADRVSFVSKPFIAGYNFPVRWRRQAGRSSDMIDARRGGMRPAVAVPSGLGLLGAIVFVLIQVLAGGSGAGGAFAVDDPFTQSPQARWAARSRPARTPSAT